MEGWQAKLARPAAALLELLQARGFVDGSASSARLSVREECRSVLAAVRGGRTSGQKWATLCNEH